MSSGDSLTTIDVFCEFFEVVTHSILYLRKLYPVTIFEKRRKYGITVYKSIHPDVNNYITESLKAIHFHLKKNQLRRIFLCFHASERVLEKFNFDILNLNKNLETDPFLAQLEQFLRDFCLKLHASLNYLDELPDDATFTIELEITERASVEFNQNPSFEEFPWIRLRESESGLLMPEIVPLHGFESDIFKLQLYIERSCS